MSTKSHVEGRREMNSILNYKISNRLILIKQRYTHSILSMSMQHALVHSSVVHGHCRHVRVR